MLDKRTVSISLPEQLIEKIDNKSNEIGINRSAYVTTILFDYFKKEELMKNLPDMLTKMTNLTKDVKQLNDIKDFMDKASEQQMEIGS